LAAAESLGRYLGAARAGYGEVDEEGEIVRVRRDWIVRPEVGSLAGEARILDGFGPDIVAKLRAGRTLVVEDCMADPRAGEAYAETWNSIGCRSLVVVPLVRDDQLRALFYLHEPCPRLWTDEEVALADEVAARTWDAVARARAEDALRASETRYRTLFEAIDAGFCILQMKIDAQGQAVDYRFDEVNPAFGRQTGLFEAQGRWIRDLTPDFEQHWVDLYGRVARTREPARYENASEALGRWFDVYAFAIDGPDDGRVAVLFNDISERKQAELELTELNRTLEARVAQTVAERDMIWRTSQDLFLVCGFDGYYRSANPAWRSVMGYDLDDVVGSRFDAMVHPDDIALAAEAFESLVAGNVVKGLDVRMRASDGSERWVSWTCVPQGDAFYAAGRDVTGRKELEEQLRQSQKMEAVGQLTGGIAHDFNNLLTIVSGNIDMAKRSLGVDGNPRALRSLGNAAKGADRAAALTQRLLAFSRRQPLQPRETDVNKLITGMTELLDRALGETVDLQVVTGAGLWRVEVDPNQLENAILNLAVNARDAMPTGGKLTIETNNAAIDDAYAASQREVVPGQYVLISVTDTGEGMPPEIVAKAFDPFFSTKEVGKGTGLGLSQVYGYVKQSGGHVKIYSEAGQGTTIKIYLPRLVAAINGAEEDAAEAVPAAPGMESILVVEDDDDVRIYTVDSLRELGYRVLEAHDAASALRLLERQEEAPRLLLTDVVMPGMSGRELADTARAKWPEMRVLFTTGYARNAIVHGGRLDAGVELLPKPFTYEALAAKVREVLEKSGSGRAMVLDPSEKERGGIAAALTELGFEAEPAADLREALGKLRAAAGRFDIVVLSDRGSAETVDAAVAQMHAVRNDLPVLIISTRDAERLAVFYADHPCIGVTPSSRMPGDLEEHLIHLRVNCANGS
jgi:PAS domain S-box-containing protein